MQIIGTYYIRSKKSNKYLTIKNQIAQNHFILNQKGLNFRQKFELVTIDHQLIQIIDPISKKYLTLAEGSDQNGAPLILKERIQKDPNIQSFQIHYTDNQYKQSVIFTFCGKCLDCCEQSTKNGTQIIQWDFHGSSNQKWTLQKA